MAFHQRITIFDDLDVPIDGAGVSTCGTDPSHARPYMKFVKNGVEATANVIEGRSTIGQINVEIIDKRTDPADQTSGWFTALLADAGGENRLSGRRCLVEQQDELGVYYTVFNGVIDDIILQDTLVTYTVTLRDERERERAQMLFVSGETTSVLPPGVTGGYGQYVTADGETGYLVPPAPVIPGVWNSLGTDTFLGITWGRVTFTQAQDIPKDVFEEKYAPVLKPAGTYNLTITGQNIDGFVFNNIIIRWRPSGGTDNDWVYIRKTPAPIVDLGIRDAVDIIRLTRKNGEDVYSVQAVMVSGYATDTLPTEGQAVEMQVLNGTSPSENFPLFIEMNGGELLKKIYDGDFCSRDPKIRYNTTAMNNLIAKAPILRCKITEPVDDMRRWVEEHIYKLLHYIPAIDENGEIAPVSSELPDVSVTLTTLDQTNCHYARWKHASSDAVNRVSFKWKTDSLTFDDPTKNEYERLVESDNEDVYIDGAAAYINAAEVAMEPATMRDIAPGHMFDTSIDQAGAATRMFTNLAHKMIDRFRFGGQRIIVEGARRSDPAIQALKVGDWVECGFPWLPDYGSHKRGMSRVAQVIKVKNTTAQTREFELLDSGPGGAPLTVPTINSVTQNDGRVSVAVTAVVGADVAVAYAVSDTEPASNSGLWQKFGRGPTGTYTTPALPTGAIVWIHARSEGQGKRPSVWTAAETITITATPDTLSGRLYVDDNGHVIVEWTPNTFMVGARVYFGAFASSAAIVPLTEYTDLAASVGTLDLGAYSDEVWIVVEIEAWSGFTGGAVSGSAGNRRRLSLVTSESTTLDVTVPPIISYTVDKDTSMLSVAVQGGAGTYETRAHASLHHEPTGLEIDGVTPSPAGEQTGVFTDILELKAGKRFYIGGRAYNSSGEGTAIARISEVWLGLGSTLDAEVIIDEIVSQADKIIYKIAFDNECAYCQIWVREFTADPGIIFSVEHLTAYPYRILTLGTDAMQPGIEFDLEIPIALSTNWLMVTFVPFDHLDKRGVVQTLLTQGNQGVIEGPQGGGTTSPPDEIFGTDLKLWWDPTQETAYAGGDPLTTVTDFSGNGNDGTADWTGEGIYASQGNATYETDQIVGKPMFKLKASDGAFNTLAQWIDSPTILTPSGGCLLMGVGKHGETIAGSNNGHVEHMTLVGFGTTYLRMHETHNNVNFPDNNGIEWTSPTAIVIADSNTLELFVFAIRFASTTEALMWLNGVQDANGNFDPHTDADTPRFVRAGHGNWLLGDVILVQGVPDASLIEAASAYFTDKWTTTSGGGPGDVPDPLFALEQIDSTESTITVRATMPAVAPDQVKIRVNLTKNWYYDVTVAGGATQDFIITGLLPDHSYSLTAYCVAAGMTSEPIQIIGTTASTGGTLDAPTDIFPTYSEGDQTVIVQAQPGANNPADTEYLLEFSVSSGGPYSYRTFGTNDPNGSGVFIQFGFPQRTYAQTLYMKVWAEHANWTDSPRTTEFSVEVPAR